VGGVVSALCVIPIPEMTPKLKTMEIKTETPANVRVDM
jgi:hypothetical protein